jgi:ferric-chelate reductase
MADVVEDASVVDIVLSFGPSLRETSQGLILYLNLFVVVILSIFVLANAPRAYARFSQTSEWAQGFFLWSAPSQSRKPTRQPSTRSIPVSTKNGAKQDRVVVPAQGEKHGPSPPKLSSFPRHVPAHPAFLRDAASILRRPSIWPGLPLGRIALFSIYMGILTYGGFYRSDPVRDPDRIGFVSVSQIPLVFALATKNNMIGFTNGIGYERVCLLCLGHFLPDCPL